MEGVPALLCRKVVQPEVLQLHMLKHGHFCLEVLPEMYFVVFLQVEVGKILI